jgi:hypothetical protein
MTQEQNTAPTAITLYQAAEALLGRKPLTLGDFDEAGVSMLGGCEVCGASVAAYNACPSKSGYIRCASGCIGDRGFLSVPEYIAYHRRQQADDLLQGVLALEEDEDPELVSATYARLRPRLIDVLRYFAEQPEVIAPAAAELEKVLALLRSGGKAQ